MKRGYLAATLVGVLIWGQRVNVSYAVLYPFEIFTTNGGYCDDSGVDLTVNVTGGSSLADFTFYNDSAVECSIARIYFTDGLLAEVVEIINGPGTNFSICFPGPRNLPGGRCMIPPFNADRTLAVGAVPPPPKNGINSAGAGEWVKISFNLINGATPADVLDGLNTGALRVGLHIIAFDDGSSESAVLVPEPATICLLALGILIVLKRQRRKR